MAQLDAQLEEIKTLYLERGLNAREIAERLNISQGAIYSFMHRRGIKLRTPSEANKIIFNRSPFSFSIKTNLTEEEKGLQIAGTMLYWGEGFKSETASGIDFANSNPSMISTFLKFLRIICGIDEFRLRVFIYCYANQNPPALIEFWSELTGIPKSQFPKPYVRQDFDPAKSGKMVYGLIHIRYCDKRLLGVIKEWIAKYAAVGVI